MNNRMKMMLARVLRILIDTFLLVGTVPSTEIVKLSTLHTLELFANLIILSMAYKDNGGIIYLHACDACHNIAPFQLLL